jgi:hypothetical protein
MQNQIINEMDIALSETLQLLALFNEKELNTVPFEGSWTAAQVGQHLFKSEKDIDQLLHAPAQVAERKPDERAAQLKELFLDFSTKMKSPDFILPEEKEYDKTALSGSLQTAKEKVVEAAKKANLTEIAPLPDEHPLVGVTKLEILHFITYHTLRHNHQLQKIRELV